MPELVAGDVLPARVIGKERGVVRVQVEMEPLVAAPTIPAGVQALWRLWRTVGPARGAVGAVVGRTMTSVR